MPVSVPRGGRTHYDSFERHAPRTYSLSYRSLGPLCHGLALTGRAGTLEVVGLGEAIDRMTPEPDDVWSRIRS